MAYQFIVTKIFCTVQYLPPYPTTAKHVFSQSSFFSNLFSFPSHPPYMNFSHEPESLLKKNIGNAAWQPPASLLRLHRAGRPTLAELRANGSEVKYNITLSNIIKQESYLQYAMKYQHIKVFYLPRQHSYMLHTNVLQPWLCWILYRRYDAIPKIAGNQPFIITRMKKMKISILIVDS